MRLQKLAMLILASGLSIEASAIQLDMKPGLWEHSFKLSGNSAGSMAGLKQDQMNQAMAEMKKQMANMPPEQKKMMEEMMSKHGVKMTEGGVELAQHGVQISKEGTLVKVCLTREEIEKGEMPQMDKNCEQKVTQVAANVLHIKYACKGQHTTQGEGKIIFQNDKAYTGDTKLTTEINGKMETIEGSHSGRWISNDCGDIKPNPPKQ